jgi:exodeoxyribonuclease V gamma subunit
VLLVHRSERADCLVESLGDLLLDAPDDPMAGEIVAVPTRGVERWLTQRLSHRLGATSGADGVCANIEFPFPGSLVEAATSAACGLGSETDPWQPDRSVWPLLELVDESLAEVWLQPLVSHLRAGSPKRSEGEEDGLRRFATIRHLADLYDRYAVHRPDMVIRWAEGTEHNEDARPSAGSGEGSESHWQAELWRRLRHRIGVPSPAERLGMASARLAEDPNLLDLPPRLSLFGLTRLPASHLRIFDAIGQQRDVHLFLLHPSGRLWDAIAVTLPQGVGHPPKRSDDTTVALAANPLLRSWGRDAREMQLVLQAQGVAGGEHRPVPERTGENPSILQRLQADVRADRPPPGLPRVSGGADPRPPLDFDDDSLRIHSCHGRLRQVEVMRDAILHLLADDTTLEPRDVVVMCPDIESFAPLVHAVFGSSSRPVADDGRGARPGPEPGPPQIRVRLADRSIRQTNPLLAVAAQLLELAADRVAASEVLDLAEREPVARRFRFDEDELGRLEAWVAESGIRWGLDRKHRARWRLDQVGDNTWQAGLDRLLLGVAMAEEEQRLYEGVLPVDDVSSGAVDLAGRFAEFIERLAAGVDQLQGRHTIGEWAAALVATTESLAVASPHEQWQLDQLHWVLAEVVEAMTSTSTGAGASTCREASSARGALLDLAEVRSLLDDRLRGRPTRANFRTGDLTICTLVPMRAVPHRVIGLLGLDDGAFPRHAAQDGDDLLLAEPRVGDRDARSEDRQLLLDALLAATEHLIVTYEGHDPRTNQERSPCVPVAELLDVVDRTVRVPDGSSHSRARDHVVVEHPLQSFDPRNFGAAQVAGDSPWSFDPVELAGARAHALPPAPRRPFLSRPLERLDNDVVSLDSLVRFLEHPVRAFLRERLGWYGSRGSEQLKDELPVELDALELWGVGDRMLEALLGGATLDQARAAEQGRGLLPPGALASRQLDEVTQAVESLAAAVRRQTAEAHAAPASVEINVRLPDGRAVIGTVPDVYETTPPEAPGAGTPTRIVRCIYSQLGPKHRLAAWARFLALTAAHPEREVAAVTIGRGTGKPEQAPRITMAALPPLGGIPDERRRAALSELVRLLDLYERGMCEPLPLYTKTSEKYVDALHLDRDVRVECDHTWKADGYNFGEAGDPEHVLVLGGIVPVEELFAGPAGEDETGPGWGTEPSRFGRLACRLWEPLLAHEHREYR